MKNKKLSVRFLTESAVIAALYAAATYLSAAFSLAYGPVQFRLSEALTVLSTLPRCDTGADDRLYHRQYFEPDGHMGCALRLGGDSSRRSDRAYAQKCADKKTPGALVAYAGYIQRRHSRT